MGVSGMRAVFLECRLETNRHPGGDDNERMISPFTVD